MTDDGSLWSNMAALGASAGALITSLLRRPQKQELHSLRGKAQANETRVAVLEARYSDIDRRLGSIEKGQMRLEDKLDIVLRAR